jgi:hypothetical protein
MIFNFCHYELGLLLRVTEHTCGQLWHKYSLAVNQVMVSTIKRSKWWLQLYYWEPLLRNICVTTGHRYVPLLVIIIRSFPHVGNITGFTIRVTRSLPNVVQKLISNPRHHISPLTSITHELPTKQMIVKTNRTSALFGNRSVHRTKKREDM